ncbi:Sulfatase [Crateriforma conspicua]|uniref:Sulfatase n=1 Tax=Crateriforma conspicua TaxID=2527996 RepID=A0A5C6FMV8_9PLAN|nr:Sulfatase [Crateriforma conspicua]
MDLDAGIGEVLDRLKELGLDEKTCVIFTSDNGPWFGGSTGGLRGMKASTYEAGYRVPCIARWPGHIPPGHTNDSPAMMMDLFTTVLNIADVPPPDDRVIDGQDIMSLLTSDADSPHEVTFGQAGPRLAHVRDARWKLHVLPPSDRHAEKTAESETWVDWRAPDGVTLLAPFEQARPSEHPGLLSGDQPAPMQLFDLKNDLGEQKDVSAKHPEVVQRLKTKYDTMQRVLAETTTK